MKLIKHTNNAGYRGQCNTLSGMWYESKLAHGGYYFDLISFKQVQLILNKENFCMIFCKQWVPGLSRG